jgi:uncharacterized membrane protein YqjE
LPAHDPSVEAGSDTPREGTLESGQGPISGLFRSLARLVASFIAIARTRLDLLTTELQQEIHRVAEIMVWTVIALLAALIGLFLLALVIVFVFWDTHRLLASVAVTSAFFAIAAIAGLVLRAKIRGRPRLLEATLAELSSDVSSLKAAARLHSSGQSHE